jgi:conjugative relaxase-like TrwC/TraI family protein
MLSVTTIKSGIREKEDYYTEDESLAEEEERDQSKTKKSSKKAKTTRQVNYYAEAETQSGTARLTQAIWFGDSAQTLGLEGRAFRSDFAQLFHGYQPGRSQRIRGERPDASTQERLAEDFTFSAPKSVSMALHLRKDYRVFDAHMEAVKECLEVLEQRYATTRIQTQGVREVVHTGNLIAALIPHHTSRAGDMQLHTHAVVMNGTLGPDGVFRALHNDAMSLQGWLGHLYQQKLAHKLQDLGYSLYQTQVGFEIEGYSRDQIEQFSKRSRAIVRSIQKRGLEVTPETRDKATLVTRQAKHITQTLEEYQDAWAQEAATMEIVPTAPADQPVPWQGEQTAAAELASAIAHLSERSVSFGREDIYQYVFPHFQHFEEKEIDVEIAHHRSLISLGKDRFTTAEALEQEIEIRQRWMAGQGQASPLLAHPQLEETGLNPGQAEAVSRTLTSTDTHQIIHGLSGVGKTTALGELVRQLEGSGIEVRAFSPTIDAAATLQDRLGIRTQTVEHLVLSQPEQAPNQLWIIDEAGMVSARQMQTLGRKAEAVGARLLLVGDKGQNSSIEAGSPLRSLMDYGATTHSLRQIIRQQNSIQRQAVSLIAEGQGSAALELLDANGYVTELESSQDRARAIADQYLGLSQKERNKTAIVTGTNAERLRINQAIREGQKAEGSLGPSVKAVQLVSRQFTQEQSRRVHNYQVGDYIRLHRDYRSTPLKKGQLYKVEEKRGEELLVSSYGGRRYRFNPADYKDKEVFRAQSIEIAVGDQLRWTATEKDKGRINGKGVTVTAIEGTTLSVQDRQGQTQEVSLLQPLAVDYNLVSTSYRAQSKSQKRVIVSATSDPTSAREPFYVQISRQVHHLSVYTQDLEQLRDWVKRSSAQQNPLELLGEQYGIRTSPDPGRSRRSTDARHAGHQDSESRADSPKQGAEATPQQLHEHHPNHHPGRAGELSGPVPAGPGEPQPLRNRPGDSGAGRGDEGAEEQADQLRADAGRHEQPGQLRRNRDSGVQHSPVQQQPDEVRRSTGGADESGGISAEAIAALPDSLTGHIHTLADLVTEWRDQQSLQTLLGQIQELAQQLEQRSEGWNPERPHYYPQMEGATAALVQGQDHNLMETQGLIQELRGLAQQLASQPQPLESHPYEAIQRVTELLSAENDQQLVQNNTLIAELVELTQHLASAEPEIEAYQYRNLDETVDSLTVLETEGAISNVLEDINNLVAQFDLHLQQSLAQAQTQILGEALQGWRSQQQLAEAVLGLGDNPDPQTIQGLEAALTELAPSQFQPEEVERLVELVQEWRDQQALEGIIGQIQTLAEHLSAHLQLRAEKPYQYSQMEEVATALAQSEDNHLLETQSLIQDLKALTQQLAAKQDRLTPQQYDSLQKVTALLSTEDDQRLVQGHGLLEELTELVQQLTPAEPGVEAHQYQNLEEVVERLSVLETEAQVSAVLQDIQELLEEVNLSGPSALDHLVSLVQEWQDQQALGALTEEVQGVAQALSRSWDRQSQEQSHQYPQMENATAALTNWQDDNLVEVQGLIEDVKALTQLLISHHPHLEPQRYETIHRVSELLTDMEDHRLVQNSQLVEVLAELCDLLQELEPTSEAHLYSQMQAAAEQVGQYRAEVAVSETMTLFKDMVQQVKQQVQHHPAIQQLAQTVRELRTTEIAQGPAAQPLQKLAVTLRQQQLSPTPAPQKREVFWQPGPVPEAPAHIDPAHWREWVEDSCIHPAIAAARLESIEGDAVYDRLLANKLATMGSGQYVTKPMARLMKAYEQLALDGGWWTDAGVDPRSFPTLQPGQRPEVSLYGTFKPNTPRQDEDGKPRKYENPLGLKQALFERDLNFSTVPDEIAEQIYQKYGITPTPQEKASGFWYVVYKHPEIPIYRTEGNKKDAAITSQGRVVISGQGVNAGYRARDQFGNPLPQRVLHPQLEVFAQPGREIRFAFDQDSKLSTILNVRQDLVREAELLKERGCQIYSLSWDHHQGKGADDLILNQGPLALEQADARAVPIEQVMKQHYRTKYNAIARKVKRELGALPPERLDLEVYLQAIGSGDNKDGARFLSQSDTARLYRKASPGTEAHYVQALAEVAGTYLRLKEREIPKLDQWAVRAVQVKSVSFGQEEEEKLKQRLGRSL